MEGDEATGERAQEFRAVRRLGGGQSRTWLATDPEGRWVVLKRLPDGADALGRARFVREASILQRLDGIPGISRLVAVGDELGEPWIALRALPFESAATLAPGALRPDEIAAMGAHLGETLDAAHRCGVVHRDVTPANVVLADVPALIDWGSAVADGVVLDGTLRGLDAWVGTPRFTPPEARSGCAPPSPATDVFGLGATLASLLGPGSPSAGALRDLCDAATDPDPARRPSMGALSAALAALAASAEPPVRAASWGFPDAVLGDAVGPASAAGAVAGVAARGTRRDGRAAVRSHVAALRRAAAEAAELTTVRLTGPAGGGKTWLLAAAADDAMRDGWRVWHATCAPGITDVRALDPWLRDADG
ncbi:MAG TPA: serine/threonine-protein kinase, partial [Microthrixaceae bacterium]|nr:serine/threonine-protein kinase [Microthrixaceae bacterium]